MVLKGGGGHGGVHLVYTLHHESQRIDRLYQVSTVRASMAPHRIQRRVADCSISGVPQGTISTDLNYNS